MKTEKLVNATILRALDPIHCLDAAQVGALARQTYFETLAPGESLFSQGDNDHWAYYLLSGEVELRGQAGHQSAVVNGGTEESKSPLAHHNPRQADAVCRTNIIFIRIKDELVRALAANAVATNQTAPAPADDEEPLEKRIFQELERDFKADKLNVPSLPDIALKVRDAMQSPDNDADSIAKLIQADPPLAARMVQVGNSPLYRGTAPITSCRAAVSRMGLTVVRNLVMGCTLQQLFESNNPQLQEKMNEFWRQSTYVAAISAVIGTLVPRVDADRAMLAGLIHNIGALPVIAYANDHPPLAADSALLDSMIEKLSGKVGSMVLRRWKFDNELVAVPNECTNWFRDSAPQADYIDVVLLALLYSYHGTREVEDYPAFDEVPAFGKLPLGKMGPKVTFKVLETAQASIDEIHNMLQGD